MMEKLDFDGDQVLDKKEFELFAYATLEETLKKQKLAKAKKTEAEKETGCPRD